MENNNLNINSSTKEIIKTIGFSSDEYFYRWFKKHFKTTKNKYVEKNN